MSRIEVAGWFPSCFPTMAISGSLPPTIRLSHKLRRGPRPVLLGFQEPVMTRPFEGIRIIDVTHVLAGPFAAYQLAVLGADVIKVEHPHDPDQSRLTGSDPALSKRNMGTSYLTQASN